MRFPIFGSDDGGPSTSATQYNFIVAAFASAWLATENQRQIPVSESCTITSFAFSITTAPGGAASRTFTIRKNGADTAVTVTITGTATTGSWTGSVSVAAGDLLSLVAVPSGTPAASGFQDWHMFVETTGQKAFIMGATAISFSNSVSNYPNPLGSGAEVIATAATDQEIVIPTAGTITKLQFNMPSGAPGAGTSYALSGRLNNTTDFLTASIADTALSSNSTGSQTVAAGDTFVVKSAPTGTPATRRASWCFTFEPTINGEIIWGYGSASNPAVNSIRYDQPNGLGGNGWTTEGSRALKLPAVELRKLYVKIGTAPGTGASRTFGFKKGVTVTAFSVTMTDTSVTANNTVDTITVNDPTEIYNFRSDVSPSPAPAAMTGGVHMGYVLYTAQGGAPASTFIPQIIFS